MRVSKYAKYRKVKSAVKKSHYDLSLSAILFYLWKAGNLKAYPLNENEYPDNEDTEKLMGFELLKLKLETDLNKVPGWESRISRKKF